MSIIAVTDEQAELTLCSCASCGRHTWSRDGAELDREQALAAVRARAEQVPRSKGGRPRKKPTVEARPGADRIRAERERRVREMQALLQGFTVHGE